MLLEMLIKGLMIDPVQNVPIVLLREADGERVLPIWVGPVEANAIALQIENSPTARPMTHDLLRDIIMDLGATVARVVITDLRGATFFAYVELERDGHRLFVDARPSDAIALAMRARARLFVHARVLDQVKSVDVSSERADRDQLQRWLESLDPDDLGYKM